MTKKATAPTAITIARPRRRLFSHTLVKRRAIAPFATPAGRTVGASSESRQTTDRGGKNATTTAVRLRTARCVEPPDRLAPDRPGDEQRDGVREECGAETWWGFEEREEMSRCSGLGNAVSAAVGMAEQRRPSSESCGRRAKRDVGRQHEHELRVPVRQVQFLQGLLDPSREAGCAAAREERPVGSGAARGGRDRLR